jgi:hypothetical protein
MLDIVLPNTTVPTTAPIRQLLIPLAQPGHYLLKLDSSALEHITKCPTSAFNYLVLKREAHARDASLTFGGSIHKGIEHLLVGSSDQQQDQAITNYFVENPTPPDEYRTPTMALRVMDYYRRRYKLIPDMQFEVIKDQGKPLVEIAFEVPLAGIDVNTNIQLPDWPEPQRVRTIHVAWSGRIDLVARKNGRNLVVDHKTTSVAGDQYIQSFHLSSQAMGYVWTASKLWPELNIQSFCLNGIGLRRCKDDSVPIMALGPRGGEAPLTFFQTYYTYSPEMLEQWENNVTAIISDFVHCIVRNFYPQYTNSCFGKYGRCQYFDACTIENLQLRRRFLMSDSAFKPVTWDPTL